MVKIPVQSVVKSRFTFHVSHLTLLLPGLLLLSGLLLGCTALLDPPRLATATAQAAAVASNTPPPLFLSLPDGTADSPLPATPASSTANPVITVWVNESSPAHAAALRQITADFQQQYHIDVEMVLVEPALLPKLVDSAVLTYTLPDIILHPVEYSTGWAARGILDPAATEAVLAQLGRETFEPAALELVQWNGQTAALPSDGYQQLTIYRSDWFAAKNLPPPDSFAAMLTAAQTISDTANFVSGFVVPTESNLITAHRIFEQMALANGCRLIDEKGELLLLTPACQQALDFYYGIIHNYSPIGVQTDTSTRNAYLFGRTGLIMSPPSILPQLAGLDLAAPPGCPECASQPDFLAQNSDILTQLRGVGESAVSANFAVITSLGITSEADRETAVQFATFWFNQAYPIWLAVQPEMKVPMRLGTAESPNQFLDIWLTLPLAGSNQTLTDLFGPEVATQLRTGVAQSPRWGLREGQGQVVATVYQKLTLSVVLQEMLSGYFDTGNTLREAYRRIVELIPNYPYIIELIEPTATPGQ